MRGALAVFAKQPAAGLVKTRMVPPLTPRQAAELYAALLEDVLHATDRACAELGLDAVLCAHPPDAVAPLAALAPPRFRVIAQRGADLSARMARCTAELAAGGSRRIVLRGSDSPILDAARIRAALDALEEVDVAICPDRDGGYNLVALRAPARALFDHPMSTRTVLEDTLGNARSLALRTRVLESSFDLDRASDFAALAAARDGSESVGVTQLCPRTLAYLDDRSLW